MPTRVPDTQRPAEELPVYSPDRAAQIVRVSPSTLRVWAQGDGVRPRLFTAAATSPLTLSFSNLVESFVLAAMRRVHNIPMQRVRKALRFVATELGVNRPLIHTRFSTNGVRLFAEHAGQLVDILRPKQALLEKVLEQSLQRIDWGPDVAKRLYPWVRADIGGPKTIMIDPHLGFGQPVIAGTGIQARIVAERYRAGESVLALAQDYGVEVIQVEDAIRCETREAA